MSRRIALVGATGAVGNELLDAIYESDFTSCTIEAFAGEAGAESEIDFGDESLTVKPLDAESLLGFDTVVLAAPAPICQQYAEGCLKSGAVVIDCSATVSSEKRFLCVPEINQQELRKFLGDNNAGSGCLVQIPGAIASSLAVALKPIQNLSGLKRVVVSTYQAVSGSGKKGMDELWEQTRSLYNQSEINSEVFPAQIAFNCIPNIGNFADSSESFEEQRITSEVKALLAQPDLGVSVTAVQVPVFSCHAISVNIELDNVLDAGSARDLLRGSPGVIVADDPSSAVYPQGVDVTGSAATHVGRIRNDSSLAAGLNLWIVVDNLRKSAALSVLRILQTFSEC